MAKKIEAQFKRVLMGRLTYGRDLLEELTEICQAQDVHLGRLEAIGAVQSARIGFYDQRNQKYSFVTVEQPLEIISLIGSISLKDGKPFVHAHIALADAAGKTYGGHLAPGTVVFAGEFVLVQFDGPALVRSQDEQTGLQLW
ncbi:MAG: PPC domain-containing DNA-binding protein [Kiritimatiellia bacterium]